MNKHITDALNIVSEIAYKTTDFASIYPITPSSLMGENYSKFSESGKKNIFNNTAKVREMQSEAGAIACAHGATLSGSFSTTFTSSQGLLLMLPNMYKMANELIPFVMHVASRSISSHALNIFCDHTDIMSAQKTGFTILSSSSVQEAQDFAMLANMITLKSKIPVLHFFDGFRTSHEINTINKLSDEEINALFPFKEYYDFKHNSITNISPVVLGTNQNADIYFQAKESINTYLNAFPNIINACFDDFYNKTGRKYSAFEYYGNKNASKVLVLMASASQTAIKTLKHLNGDYGIIKVNVFNPFIKEEFLKVLPKSTKTITVLDRTKENGSVYESLCLNVISSIKDLNIKVLGGRYGLGGKDFSPAMVKACFSNMENEQKDNFTIGIDDDISNTSLKLENFEIEENEFSALFYGLGSDGMVTSAKNTLKIIGTTTNNNVMGYFDYDSKKSGSLTSSEIIISKNLINHSYTLKKANIIVVNNIEFLNRFHKEKTLKENGILILNTKSNLEEILNDEVKSNIANNNIQIFTIDANGLALKYNLGKKINLVMQTAFFNIANIIEFNKALSLIKFEAKQSFKNKNQILVENCLKACDDVQNSVKRYIYPNSWKNLSFKNKNLSFNEEILNLNGNSIKVSSFKAGGKYEEEEKTIPFSFSENKACWLKENCIECNGCSMVCPHNAIKSVLVEEKFLKDRNIDYKLTKNGLAYAIYIDKEKCTGCNTCVLQCPTKNKALKLTNTKATAEDIKNAEYIYGLENNLETFNKASVKGLEFNKSYFNFCSACSGCAETQYYKLLSRICGSHLVISNATGCSSIYGGSVGVCPFNKDKHNLGTSFVSNLFEDNAEFGLGMNIGYNLNRENLLNYIKNNLSKFNDELQNILATLLENSENYAKCFEIYNKLKEDKNLSLYLKENLNYIMPLVHFIVGGDGFAYDIDFGGLDHIIASGENVNILILDNEVYSNTGGQTSKATNLGALTKYTNNKNTLKKDLFLSFMQYENLYFANVCLGADKNQTLKAFNEAISHNGPSVIVAYTPCINHGIDMEKVYVVQQNAVKSGYFNLFRYDSKSDQKLILDSTPNFEMLESFIKNENRYKNIDNETFEKLKNSKIERYNLYLKLKDIL